MTRSCTILIFIFCFTLHQIKAQGTSDFGVGLGYNSVWTYWYYDGDDFFEYLEHHHRLLALNIRYETAPIVTIGKIEGEIAIDLAIGIGNSDEYLNGRISDLAALAAVNASFKMLYPLEKFSPFIGIVLHFTSIYSNGKANDIWYFDDEFGEFLGGGGFSLGLEYPVGKLKLMPYYRITWSGGFSNLYIPGSDVPLSDESHTIDTFGLMVLF